MINTEITAHNMYASIYNVLFTLYINPNMCFILIFGCPNHFWLSQPKIRKFELVQCFSLRINEKKNPLMAEKYSQS